MTKVDMEAVDDVRRRLAVEVPAGDVTAEIERAYEALRRRARVPGFRPGRAPRAVLEQMYGEQVRADVFGRLVQESFADAVRTQNLQPVSTPQIITESAAPGAPLRYSATVEVRPTITVANYTGLTADRPTRTIDDADVERFITTLRERRATLRPISDRLVAQCGDIATLDYEARVAGRLVGKGDQRLVEIGPDPADGPGARLEGVRVGEATTFEVSYPADHENAELAGQTVTFHATATALAQRQVPALDEAFAAQAEFASVEELRQRVCEQLEAAMQREADAAVRASLVTRLVGAHEFEVPPAMIDRRAEVMAEEVLEELGPRRPPASREAEVRAQLQRDLREQARNQVKAALILDAVAEQEQLTVDDDALDAHVDRLAESAGRARDRVRALYQDSGARAGLRMRLLQDRALELLVERAVITNVERPSGVAGVSGNG